MFVAHVPLRLRVPANMQLLPLPPYAPELNPVEHLCDELREKNFHNHVFDSLDALEDHLVASLRSTEDATDKDAPSSRGRGLLIQLRNRNGMRGRYRET
jgi:transposase